MIDLEAKEVPAEAAAVEPVADKPTETPAEIAASSDPAPQQQEPFIPPPPVTPEAAAEADRPLPPPPLETPPEEPTSGHRPSFAFVPQKMSWSHGLAALAGAAGGLLVFLALWFAGVLAGSDPSAGTRLAAIEKQLNEIAGRPAPASLNPQMLEDIAARLAKIESAQATPRPPITDPVVLGRITAAENALKSLADNAAALSRRAEATDAAARDTNGKIEKLNATLGELQTTVKAAAAGSDRASRLAVAASALRGAVERGDPFTTELAIVKPLVPDAAPVAVLEPFAAAGVPGNAALGLELAALVRPLLRASEEPPASGGFLDRLEANAQKLVRKRPMSEEARGDDRAAILSRVEQRASQGNIAGASAELAKLPPDDRALLAAWLAKVDARNRAIDASRKLSADAVVALKGAP